MISKALTTIKLYKNYKIKLMAHNNTKSIL